MIRFDGIAGDQVPGDAGLPGDLLDLAPMSLGPDRLKKLVPRVGHVADPHINILNRIYTSYYKLKKLYVFKICMKEWRMTWN